MCRPEISTNMGVQSMIKVPRDPLKHFRTCECACGVPACGFNRKSFHLPIRPSGCGRCRACRDVFDEKRKNRRGTVTKLWDPKLTHKKVQNCLVVRKQKKFWKFCGVGNRLPRVVWTAEGAREPAAHMEPLEAGNCGCWSDFSFFDQLMTCKNY